VAMLKMRAITMSNFTGITAWRPFFPTVTSRQR
jgi:hypothetical protein